MTADDFVAEVTPLAERARRGGTRREFGEEARFGEKVADLRLRALDPSIADLVEYARRPLPPLGEPEEPFVPRVPLAAVDHEALAASAAAREEWRAQRIERSRDIREGRLARTRRKPLEMGPPLRGRGVLIHVHDGPRGALTASGRLLPLAATGRDDGRAAAAALLAVARALEQLAARSQPAPVVTVTPDALGPLVAALGQLAARPDPVLPPINVTVEQPRPRSVRVELDEEGRKVFRPIDD